MNSKTHTLSFCILDDLEPRYGPVDIEINDLEYETISNAVEKIAQQIIKNKSDCTGCYFYSTYDIGNAISLAPKYDNNLITYELLENGYYVLNQFEKYYVIAFALDYKEFKVFSRNCYKKLIEW